MNKAIEGKQRKISKIVTGSAPVSILENQVQFRTETEPSSYLMESTIDREKVWETSVYDSYYDGKNSRMFTMVTDLLHNLDEIGAMLSYELENRSWMNAYLLAAGVNQIVEDYLHPDLFQLGKLAKYIERVARPFGSALANVSRILLVGFTELNSWRPKIRRIASWQRKIAVFVNDLAIKGIGLDAFNNIPDEKLILTGENLSSEIKQLPASLRNEIVRLPSCFRSFDQRPEDIKRIVEQFSINWPDRERPITLVGIRTSGSYLAPLYGVLLRARGYQKVRNITVRPGVPPTKDESRAINELVRADGLALVCDDPPITGSTLTKTTFLLENLGLPSQNIILLLQLFDDPASLQPSLQKYPSVLMSWSNWSIHKLLELEAVKGILSDVCLPRYRISDIIRMPISIEPDKRDHAKALFKVQLIDTIKQVDTIRFVQVKGIGLGYFGDHTLAVTQRLAKYSAQTIAFKNGLIYQDIMAPSEPISLEQIQEGNLTIRMADYIKERNRQLRVPKDTSLLLDGRSAVWEIASNILSKAFGQAWFLARLPLIDPYVKRQLIAAHPSIIDGDMALKNWFVQPNDGTSLIKMELADRDFSHMDLYSYDPVYDLAGFALEIDHAIQPENLLINYEIHNQDDKVTPERWMLYQLVHLWDQARLEDSNLDKINRKMANVVQKYYEQIYFHDLKVYSNGQLGAIDLDGVLETNQLGFPSLTASSARSLRALILHGYTLVLVTGRSIEDIKERCAAYHLLGGVAEYGAVLYNQSSGQVKLLLTNDELQILNNLRNRIIQTPGLSLDLDYKFAIRVYQKDKDGERRGMSADLIAQVLDESGTAGEIYAIPGISQTDFMVNRINKGFGLKQWLSWVSNEFENMADISSEQIPIEFAFGDSASDLPMFSLAKIAFAPANANKEVKKAGIRISSRPYQRGLSQAVTNILGHEPGRCAICQMDDLNPGTQYMQDILSIQENGPIQMLLQAAWYYARRGRLYNVG